MMYQGTLLAMRPFWVATIDPDTWERWSPSTPSPAIARTGSVIDNAKEYIYPIMSSSVAAKVDIRTGEIIWTNGTGIGPYGAALNADETELWVADKGEAAHHLGAHDHHHRHADRSRHRDALQRLQAGPCPALAQRQGDVGHQ